MFSANTMTCVDVMYQPYPYFPYHHPAHTTHQRSGTSSAIHGPLESIKKFGVGSKHVDPMDCSPFLAGGLSSHGSPPGPGGGAGTSPTTPPAGQPVSAKEESDQDRTQTPHNTQYLSSNCVLVTYFAGDISANVDEHFSRALSQPASFSGENHGSKSGPWKEASPMSQRNFPPSFWNSAYQPPSASSHQDLPGFTTDPYTHMTSSLHSMHGSLHNDPWRYPLSSQTYSHHGMHDFAGYSSAMAASSSRFNPHHYSSLLPGSRFTSMTPQCDPLSKHTDTWGSRYSHSDLTSSLTSHHEPMTSLHPGLGGGIEVSATDNSKDLYWF